MSYQDKVIKRIVEMYEELGAEGKRDVIDQIRFKNVLKAAEEVKKTKTVYFGDLYADALDMQKFFNQFEGFRSGLQYFDDSIMGFRPGEMIVIAGPQNLGKTSIALNLAVSTVVNSQKTGSAKKVLIISLEMTALQIASRLVNMADRADHDALMENIIIQTELDVSTAHIAAMIEQHQPDLLLLDHIQFLANQEQGKEYERITAAVARLKRMTIKYKLPVIAISHVSRTRSGRNGEATAMDLKGSSSIEQDCDIGFMLNKPADNMGGNEIEVVCFKHRMKRPKTFHKPCTVRFDGLRLADAGAYTWEDQPASKSKQQTAPVQIPESWR